MSDYSPGYLWVRTIQQHRRKLKLTFDHEVDHDYLRRLPCFILLRQIIDPILLPPSFRAAGEASIHDLLPLRLLHHLLRCRFLRYHWPLQRQQPPMGYHRHDELLRLRQADVRDWRSGSGR